MFMYSVGSGLTTTNSDPWPLWSNATSATTSTVWVKWTNAASATSLYQLEQLEAEAQQRTWTEDELREIRAESERAAARMREYRAELERGNEKMREAEARAEALLLAYLDDVQRRELKEHGRITVCAKSGTKYRIRRGSLAGNVDEVDDSGNVRRRLCAHPKGVPASDALLTQLFMLRHHEADFLRVANVH